MGAGDGLDDALGGDRLVVPFDEGTHQLALGIGRMEIVDGAPEGGIGGSAAAQHHHRRAAAIGVVDAHGAVHQPDHVMERRQRRPARGVGIGLGHGDGGILVGAQDHLGGPVAAIVDEGIVQPPETRAGVEEDVSEAQRMQQIDHRVGGVLGGVAAHLELDRGLDLRAAGGGFNGIGVGFVHLAAHPVRPCYCRRGVCYVLVMRPAGALRRRRRPGCSFGPFRPPASARRPARMPEIPYLRYHRTRRTVNHRRSAPGLPIWTPRANTGKNRARWRTGAAGHGRWGRASHIPPMARSSSGVRLYVRFGPTGARQSVDGQLDGIPGDGHLHRARLRRHPRPRRHHGDRAPDPLDLRHEGVRGHHPHGRRHGGDLDRRVGQRHPSEHAGDRAQRGDHLRRLSPGATGQGGACARRRGDGLGARRIDRRHHPRRRHPHRQGDRASVRAAGVFPARGVRPLRHRGFHRRQAAAGPDHRLRRPDRRLRRL